MFADTLVGALIDSCASPSPLPVRMAGHVDAFDAIMSCHIAVIAHAPTGTAGHTAPVMLPGSELEFEQRTGGEARGPGRVMIMLRPSTHKPTRACLGVRCTTRKPGAEVVQCRGGIV